MRTFRLAIATLSLCALCAPAANAANGAEGLQYPSSVRQTSLEPDMTEYYVADATQTAPGAQPATPAVPAATPAAPSAETEAVEETAEEGFKLFKLPGLEKHNIDVRGWIDQGFTMNPDRPADRFNGPVTYNDRANEYQMNQAYLLAERATRTDGCGIDIGGRIDMVYGTDWRFMQANGLESNWNESQRFYGLAMPQLYADVAVNDLIIRSGRFYSPIGFDSAMAPENFFYSKTYAFQYGEPTTFTGMMGKYALNDRLSANFGFSRGWDQWEDNNDKLNYFGGVNWESLSKNTSIAFEMILGNELANVESKRTTLSMVFTQKLTERFKYVFQTDYTRETNAYLAGGNLQDAEWYSIVNYFFYDLNPCWSLGFRYEVFGDRDGVRVAGLGYPRGVDLDANPARWQELAMGVNYKPNANVIVRSEVRWDWEKRLSPDTPYAFDNGHDGGQALWGTDLIFKF
jgi:hypothetical protein